MRDSKTSFKRVPSGFLGIQDFPYLNLRKLSGFGVLKQNRGEIWDWMSKLTLGITGLKIPNGDPLLRLQLGTLEEDSNLHICNCHAKRQLKLALQYTSISNWSLLTWRWHLRRGNVIQWRSYMFWALWSLVLPSPLAPWYYQGSQLLSSASGKSVIETNGGTIGPQASLREVVWISIVTGTPYM